MGRVLTFGVGVLWCALSASLAHADDKTPSCAEEIAASHRSQQARFFGENLDLEAIRRDLNQLTGEEAFCDGRTLRDRCRLSNRRRVRTFLRKRLASLGIKPLTETADVSKTYSGPVNIIGEIKGTEFPEKVFEISAHYDTTHRGAPGADDNGSGLTLALELTRLFTVFPPKYTVRIIFADLEEKGFQGTSYHVLQLEELKQEIMGAVVIDMIGYSPKTEDPFFVLEVGDKWSVSNSETLDTNRRLANAIVYQAKKFSDRKVRVRPDMARAKPGTADHGPYWRMGYPALLVSAPYEGLYINPHYHQDSDRVEAINWEYFESVSRLTAEGLAFLLEPAFPVLFQEAFEARKATMAGVWNPEVNSQAQHLPDDEPPPVRRRWEIEDDDDEPLVLEDEPWDKLVDLPLIHRVFLEPFQDRKRGEYAVLEFPHKVVVVLPEKVYVTFNQRLMDFVVKYARERNISLVRFKDNIYEQDRLSSVYQRVRETFLNIPQQRKEDARPIELPAEEPPPPPVPPRPKQAAPRPPPPRKGIIETLFDWLL